MKNQDLKSGLFGSIGENMVAFELAKRNWYIYRPYFDTRIDFIAQKFVCKVCFSDWDSKHIITCSNNNCTKSGQDLNQNDYLKNRKCNNSNCGFVFFKYSSSLNCPKCNRPMTVSQNRSTQGQRNFKYKCSNSSCTINEFSSQTRSCVKCGSINCDEYPTCKLCNFQIIPKSTKCSKSGCNSTEYANIYRSIQIKSSHEEDSGSIGFNFKLQDLVDDERHFLVVYSRTFKEFLEKHNYWIMSVDEFKNEYVTNNAATTIYQNNRLHPPSSNSSSYFDEEKYNKVRFLIQKFDLTIHHINRLNTLQHFLSTLDVFGKLNLKLNGDF